MKRLAVAVACIWMGTASAAAPTAEMVRQLDEIGRVATVMVDGDACQRIMSERALGFMGKIDPKDPYLASDNFDVNDEPYNQVKKTLIRLSRLASFPTDVNLWMPIPGRPGKIQVLIRNVHEMSQFWRWGAIDQDTPGPMKTVLADGQRVTVTNRPGWVSVLAPVYNSLGDVVGLVEAVAQENPDLRENVK